MVSVIVPNYNYGRYLRERLRSIFAQTYPIFEIIVLDDASVDDSTAVAQSVADEAGRLITIDRRETNSGNAFRQWKAGVDRARGEFIWIAEADDSSDPNFLKETLRRLTDHPSAALCFTDSRAIDADSADVYESYKGYYREHGDTGLDQNGIFGGDEFLRRFLVGRNLILNASAVVWRADALLEVFDRLDGEETRLNCAGDWRIYIEACRLKGTIAYESRPLNIHRRHAQSITSALDKTSHLREIEYVNNIALSLIDDEPEYKFHTKHIINGLRKSWDLEGEEHQFNHDNYQYLKESLIGFGAIIVAKYNSSYGYEHFNITLSDLRMAGKSWKNVRYKIVKIGEAAKFEFRFHSGWNNYLPDVVALQSDEYGTYTIIDKEDVIRFADEGNNSDGSDFLLTLAMVTPRIVSIVTRRAGFSEDVRLEWQRVFLSLRDALHALR